jgi:predicted DNA-binding protein
MAKIDATVPDKLRDDLEWIAQYTGKTLSAAIADCLELGLCAMAENYNKVEVLKSIQRRNQKDSETNQ